MLSIGLAFYRTAHLQLQREREKKALLFRHCRKNPSTLRSLLILIHSAYSHFTNGRKVKLPAKDRSEREIQNARNNFSTTRFFVLFLFFVFVSLPLSVLPEGGNATYFIYQGTFRSHNYTIYPAALLLPTEIIRERKD